MANYLIKWTKELDTDHHHTASTRYESDDFYIWKGRYRVFSCLYSANEWHLVRKADHKIICSARTAKECKGALEHALRKRNDVYTCDNIGLWSGVKFDDNFEIVR